MESLPKPLIVLIGSIIEEYEHFTWNSTYLGDKMRISLVWTRGELINRNNGKKHKSPSKIERDNRRSDTWPEKQESNKIESEGEIDESEHSQSSEMETESEDEHRENTKVISPSVTPVQVSTLPVDVPPVRVSINSRQIKRNTITTNRVEKKNSEENLPKTVDIKCKQTTTVASLSIVTGKSPCTDSHYEKVVFSRTSEADYVIGKVKMKNILVINKLDRSNAGIRHIVMEENKTEYESYMFYQRKFWDVRKTEYEEIRMYAKQIPRMDRYAEKYKLCPWCFQS